MIMERYTKSFIGLMEMSNAGEWVKIEDVKSLEKERDNLIEVNMVLEDVCSELSEKIDRLERENSNISAVDNAYDLIAIKTRCLEIAVNELIFYKTVAWALALASAAFVAHIAFV
jgi:predicted nuclease with TOPRIM domain